MSSDSHSPRRRDCDLSKVTVEDVAPSPSAIIVCHSDESLSDAFQKLSEHNILSAPVKGKNGFCGIIDQSDINAFVVENFNHKENVGSDFRAMLEIEKSFISTKVSQVMGLSKRNPWHSIPVGTSIRDAIHIMATQGLQRVPIVQIRKVKKQRSAAATSPLPNSPPPSEGTKEEVEMDEEHLVSLLTLSRIIQFLSEHNEALPETLRKSTLEQATMFTSGVPTAASHLRAIDAFQLLHETGQSSLAIVDDSNMLIGNLSERDLKASAQHHAIRHDASFFPRLFLSLDEYVKLIRTKCIQAVHPAISAYLSTTCVQAIGRLASVHIHRLYITDSREHPIGICSLLDIARTVDHAIAEMEKKTSGKTSPGRKDESTEQVPSGPAVKPEVQDKNAKQVAKLQEKPTEKNKQEDLEKAHQVSDQQIKGKSHHTVEEVLASRQEPEQKPETETPSASMCFSAGSSKEDQGLLFDKKRRLSKIRAQQMHCEENDEDREQRAKSSL